MEIAFNISYEPFLLIFPQLYEISFTKVSVSSPPIEFSLFWNGLPFPMSSKQGAPACLLLTTITLLIPVT